MERHERGHAMKRVALTQRLVRDPRSGELRSALDVRFAELLGELGLLPVPLPPLPDPAPWLDALGIDGLLLSGGNDLAHLSDDPLCARREALERRALRAAFERDLPILGVCRGLQQLVSLDGGRLGSVRGHAGRPHDVTIRASRFLPDAVAAVNSYHDFGVVETGTALGPVAWAPDGTIEAVEHPELPILGVMWHPERAEGGSASSDWLRGFFAGNAR